MFSSEQKFAVNGDDKEDLIKVIKLAMELNDISEVKSFFIDKNGCLVICSYKDNDADEVKYPFNPSPVVLAEQIYNYIYTIKLERPEQITALAGKEPDNDGSVDLGWEVFAPSWYGEYEIRPYHQNAFLAVKPCWIIYGK